MSSAACGEAPSSDSVLASSKNCKREADIGPQEVDAQTFAALDKLSPLLNRPSFRHRQAHFHWVAPA